MGQTPLQERTVAGGKCHDEVLFQSRLRQVKAGTHPLFLAERPTILPTPAELPTPQNIRYFTLLIWSGVASHQLLTDVFGRKAHTLYA